MLEFRNVAGPGIRFWVQLRAPLKIVIFSRQAFAPAKPAYMPSMAIRARKHRTQNHSVYDIHEEGWPQRSCFGSSSTVLPKVGTLRRRGYRGKSAFLEVPLMLRPVIAPLKNFLYHGGEIIRSAC